MTLVNKLIFRFFIDFDIFVMDYIHIELDVLSL